VGARTRKASRLKGHSFRITRSLFFARFTSKSKRTKFVSTNHNRTGTSDSLPSWQGVHSVQQRQQSNQLDIQQAEARRRIWSRVGISLGSIGTVSTSAEGINVAASGAHWLSISFLICIGGSASLFGILRPKTRCKIAQQEIFWLKGWTNDLELALIQLSKSQISREEVQEILQKLNDKHQRLHGRIQELRDTKELPPGDSLFI
jgi:hypothetical protein